MLEHPVDLVFDRPLTNQQTSWLPDTTVPIRALRFHRVSCDCSTGGWDPESTFLFGQNSALPASRETLQVTPMHPLLHINAALAEVYLPAASCPTGTVFAPLVERSVLCLRVRCWYGNLRP